MPNLSNTQKQALINEVKASETPEQVNTAVTKAKDLDTAIGKLKDDLNSLTGLKTQDNYKLADPNKQADLDNVANDAENIKNQAGAALDKKAIETLNKKIDDVKAGLNGDANKQEAKAQIDKLNNLNSEQKTAAKDSLNQANTKAELDNKVAQAQALDLAKGDLKIAQDSLDSLINQFTKPNDSNEAILAGFNNLVKQIQTAKAKLEAANTQASQALASETLNAEEVSQASSLITQAKDLANETIQAVVNNNNAILTAANVANFTDSSDKETATKAAQKALDKQGNLYQDIANARQVQHLAAIDALTKFKDSLPQDLKASQSFPLTLTGAKEELQASNTKASDDTILAKIKHQLNKDKLAKAYDAASIATISSQMPENLKQEFATEKANALELLKYANTNVDTPKTTYDAQADKLNLLLAKNHLADVIAKGMLAPSSKQLQDALAQAKEALNNNNINQEAVTSASEKLANEIDKAKLYVSINEAQDFVKELQEGNKDLHSNLRDQIVNKLNTQDIPTAQNAANAKDTEAGYNTAAAALDNAVANAKKTIADVYKTLEELRAKIAAMPEEAKSAELKAALNETKDINKNSGVVAIENALDMLQHKYATNELDKAIAAAPEINAKYAKLVPSIIEESKAVSNNSHASSQAIKDQFDKQLLNNAKGNALNELAKLNNLNNSQANNLANAIAQGKTLQEVLQTTQQANQLDKAMSQLKDNYNKVDEAYKSGTNLPYEAFFVPADKQQFVKDTIAKVGTVVPINGQVYLNNLPVEVEQLNNDLTNALNLLGQAKGQAKEMEDEFTKLNTKAQNIQVNANKLFNSPKVIQDQIKELDTQIKDLSKLYFNDHAAYMQAGNAKMKQLVEQFSALNDQVEQFSPQVFMKDNARITQAQDLINNNSQYLNDSISQNTLAQFNKATTFAQANEILNNQVKADKELKAKMDQLVTNLTNTLVANATNDQNTALMQEITATAKNAIVSELKDMKEKTETVANTKNAINTLLSKDTIDKKFKSDLETIDKDVKALPSTLRYNSYPEFVTALQTASATVKKHVDGIKLLISAHDNRNADELAQAIELLNKVDQKNAAFAQLMQERNYIGILKDADKKAITNDELASVQDLKGTTEYQMASPAIQALVNDELNNKKPLRWWPFAVAASALVWLAGLLAIVLKRK
ncbi:GA module-containing protein [Mycoplasma sp. 005V]|uniref:GA module-containing protein n=1 Tax=Mycoplasma sp. 005V TaxID=3398776 RepID=UPI003A8BDF24